MSAVEAQNWLIIGDWRECDARLRVVLGSDPGPLGDVMARLVAARAATLRGRQAEAESHLLRVEELMVDGSAYLGLEFDAVHAEVRFGAHDHDGAFRAAMNGARNSGAPPTRCEWLMPLAARALADRVQSAHDNGRTDGDALEMLDALVAQFPHVIRDIGPTTGVRGRLLTRSMRSMRRNRREPAATRAKRPPWIASSGCLRRRGTAVGGGVLELARGGGAARPRPRPADGCCDAPARPRARPAARGAAGRGASCATWRARARIPIEEPQAAASDAPAALHGLTEREREVLDLVAVGRTYSEIARTLMISEKTVSTHVSHLLAKTGTSNRVELAGLVHRVADERNRSGLVDDPVRRRAPRRTRIGGA